MTHATVGWASGHICALLDQQNVRCWGWGAHGRLGYGNFNPIGDDELAGAGGDVNVGKPVLEIQAGRLHNCALVPEGKIRCWGINSSGGLGYGHTNTIGDSELPASSGDVSVGGVVVQVAPVAVETALSTRGRAAPRTDPSGRC